MDPRTGRPVESSVLATTVVAPDCRSADGWATALMVLPPDVGLHAVEARPELEALWVIGTDGGVTVQRSSGMADWMATD
jgi:thiamine biosynthesis lipoprotein